MMNAGKCLTETAIYEGSINVHLPCLPALALWKLTGSPRWERVTAM